MCAHGTVELAFICVVFIYLFYFVQIYDLDLEAQAKEWTEKCQFKHNFIRDRGENTAKISAPVDINYATQRGFNMWNRESQAFQYDGTCNSTCGHFTQVPKY